MFGVNVKAEALDSPGYDLLALVTGSEGYIGSVLMPILIEAGYDATGLDVGWFIEPTVFGNVDNHSAIARNEIFGPVLSVIPAANEQDQIAIANDSVYGLNSAVFTNEDDRAWRFARRRDERVAGVIGGLGRATLLPEQH